MSKYCSFVKPIAVHVHLHFVCHRGEGIYVHCTCVGLTHTLPSGCLKKLCSATPSRVGTTRPSIFLAMMTFRGLALLITHVCALKMNAYLRRYIQKVQKDQLQEPKTSLQHSLTHSFFLVKGESFAKVTFTPCIPGTGLSISLNSPGFMLIILVSVFALIGALVAF